MYAKWIYTSGSVISCPEVGDVTRLQVGGSAARCQKWTAVLHRRASSRREVNPSDIDWATA